MASERWSEINDAAEEAAAALEASADAEAKAFEDAQTAEARVCTEAMQKSWDADISTLVSSGLFPKDATPLHFSSFLP